MSEITREFVLAHLRECAPCEFCQHFDPLNACSLYAQGREPRWVFEKAPSGGLRVGDCLDFEVDFGPMPERP